MSKAMADMTFLSHYQPCSCDHCTAIREAEQQAEADRQLGAAVRRLPMGARLVNHGGNRWTVVIGRRRVTGFWYDPKDAVSQALGEETHG